MSYEDIMYRPHHVSSKRASMPLRDRAAQFAPFAALTGHDGLIRETARLTECPVELTDSAQVELDRILRSLRRGMVVLTEHFVPDLRKAGGAHVSHSGVVRKVDGTGQCLIFTDGTAIPFRFIVNLEVLG